jgi:hypothetical protein
MKILRRIFGSNRNEVKGGRKKLNNKELHNLCSKKKNKKKKKLNFVAVGRKRIIPTKRPHLVGEISANLCG